MDDVSYSNRRMNPPERIDVKIKLAEALLRRKELAEKVKQLQPIKVEGLFVVRTQRKQVNENIDDLTMQVPKVLIGQVTAEYDFYAMQLRRVDAAIQQANWTTEIDGDDDVMKSYAEARPETAAPKAP